MCLYISIHIDYTEKFSDALGGPLPEPKYCDTDKLHCSHRPTCYTNYKPHYSLNKTLSEIIIGNSTWTQKICMYMYMDLTLCMYLSKYMNLDSIFTLFELYCIVYSDRSC